MAAYAGALRSHGLTLRAIAAQLEQHGFQTRKGGSWHAVQVKRILERQVSLDPERRIVSTDNA